MAAATDNDLELSADQSRMIAKHMAAAEEELRILAQFSKLTDDAEEFVDDNAAERKPCGPGSQIYSVR
jgi:hypothetical protein